MTTDIISAYILSFFGCAVLYPLYFSLTSGLLADKRFNQINFIVQFSIATLGTLLLWKLNINYQLQLEAVVWIIVIAAVAIYCWRSAVINPWLLVITSAFGLVVFTRTISRLVQITPLWPGVLSGLIAAGILAGAVINLVLGRQINGKDKNVSSTLQQTILLLLLFIALRIIWNIFFLGIKIVEDPDGNMVRLIQYLIITNGLTYFIGIFLGIVLPLGIFLGCWYRIRRQQIARLKLFLAVSLVAVWVGEWFIKYYLFQFGFTL